MKTLTLAVKKKYFNQIKSGAKKFEYRLWDTFWKNRIYGKIFDEIIITLGYPPKNDQSRRLVFPWNGFKLEYLQHAEFGPEAKWVFAIPLETPSVVNKQKNNVDKKSEQTKEVTLSYEIIDALLPQFEGYRDWGFDRREEERQRFQKVALKIIEANNETK